MNIAVLCFHALGGSGVVAAEIARGLAERGHRVHVVAPALPGRLDPAPPGVTLHAVPLEEAPPIGAQAYPLSLAARLIDLLQSERIDLIHAHYAMPHAAAAVLARAALGKGLPRLLLSLHGTDVPPAHGTEGLARLVRHLVTNADAVTAPSRALASLARERLSLPEHPAIEVMPNFVDTERFRPASEPPRELLRSLFHDRPEAALVLCHASNFRPVKRPLDVVRAFALVRAERPALLLLAGDGPDRPAVEAEVRALCLSRDVAFTGTARELAPLLSASDLFLLPSAQESFGLAALEAMSCGVPVLATRTGGLPEVVDDGQTGVLVPVGDVHALANAALRLLANDPERARLSKNARARAVQQFPAGPALDRWEALYRRLIG